ncbi:FAD-dependent monooxygenase [Nocardia sp. CA-145437]|uniref:FAD-dependent monooxygenase n=1 Tax=Nocardia sp. CA-145437 TaxID=3239980 RepID=UPI003D96A9BB
MFAVAAHGGILYLQSTEDDPADYDSDDPLTMAELGASIRRVLGFDLPLGEPTRLSRYVFQDRQAENYRAGRVFLAGDAAHLFPATGTALNCGLSDTVNLAWKLAAAVQGWAPASLLDTYHTERHYAGARARRQTRAQVALRRGGDPTPETHPLTGTFAPNLTLHTDPDIITVAELMHTSRPVLLDFTDRPELREIAERRPLRVDIITAKTDNPPADALLIRPDAYIAWAADSTEPAETATSGLHRALSTWFGAATAH